MIWLIHLNAALERIIKVGIILVAIMVIGAMTLQICGRYFLPLPFYGMDELTGHTAVWFYMLGAAYSTYTNDHIRADFLETFGVPARIRFYSSVFATCVSVVISGLLVIWSYRYVIWSIEKHEVTPSLHIPTVYFQSAILVGAILMLLFFIREAAGKIRHKEMFIGAMRP